MAKVPLQASPSATLFWEAKPLDVVRGRVGKVDRQLNSVSVSSSGVGIGGRGVGRSLWVLEDIIPTGLSKEKYQVRCKPSQWSGDRNWSSGGKRREETVRALDGDFGSKENSKDLSLENFSIETNDQSFFRDQVYDYHRRNDIYLDDSTPEGAVTRKNGKVGRFIRNEDFEEPIHAQKDVEERRRGVWSREWAQVDDEGRLPEASVGEKKEVSYKGNLDDADQRSRLTQGLSYSPNPVSESRPRVEDRKESRIVFRKARDYDDLYENIGSQPYELGALQNYPSPPAGVFDDHRYGKNKLSEIEDDEQQGQVLPKSVSIGRERTSSTMYGREVDQEESARGLLYAKQVISLATAQSLGFVTQLWVDAENVKVVALEIRPSLLFGDFYSFPLNSISKIGDVILMQDDDLILGGRDLFNCSDLVGNDLFTEDGINLGKVRDYNFSLEDGAVLSIEFDSFGVPLIPSNLIKTYSLTIDEVIETQKDSLLVRQGAENRVRKLSKGFLSRSKKSAVGRQSPRRQQRNQTPESQYLGETTERVRGISERDNCNSGYGTPRNQPKTGNINSFGKRGLVSESFRASRFESDQTRDLYPSSSFSSRSKDLDPEESEDDQTIPSIRVELPVRGKSQTSGIQQTQSSDFGISTSEMSGNSRGLPMSYRTSRPSVESDY